MTTPFAANISGQRRGALLGSALLASYCASGCGPESREATRVELPVVVDAASIGAVTTDLGYRVQLSTARLALENLEFTVAGEVHATLPALLRSALWSTAHAHPGHYQGGEVTGELSGRFIVDWLAKDGEELGIATLLAGDYEAINFTFGRATASDVDEGDALLGHTALLAGTAEKDGASYRFSAALDAPQGRQLVGLPFEEKVAKSTRSSIGLQLVPFDPYENDTLFDGIDFAALPVEAAGVVEISPAAQAEEVTAAYELLRRTFQTHDHFDAVLVQAP